MSLTSRIKKKIKFIFATKHRIAKVTSFKDYFSQACNGSYHCLESDRKTIVCPVQFIDDKEVVPFEVSLPDTYWAELDEGMIIGSSSVVVTKDGKLLYDMLANRLEYNANMTDNGLCLIGGSPKHIGNYYIYNYLRNDCLELPTAISLACHMSGNYYHFMFQVASKFYLLSQIDINPGIPIIVDEKVLQVPQLKEVIDALNIENRKIVPIRSNQLCRIKRLYILSEANVIVPNSFSMDNYRTENFAFDKKSLEYLKNTIIKRIPPSEDVYPKRIFISRKDCSRRRCNEEEIEKVVKQFGFETINMENLTIAQQISLFSNAEHIIGGSGAAFTNLLYCSRDTKATMLLSGPNNITCFSSLGIVNDVKTYFSYPDGGTVGHQPKYYVINPEKIHQHLKKFSY